MLEQKSLLRKKFLQACAASVTVISRAAYGHLISTRSACTPGILRITPSGDAARTPDSWSQIPAQ